MKKFFRNVFSGYFLVILLLLIEMGVIIVLQFFLDDILILIMGEFNYDVFFTVSIIYLFLRIVVFVIAFIIFFKIINKQEDPEFKIPWIVGRLLMPFLFSVLFLIFGNHGLRKRDRVLIEANRKAYDDYCRISSRRQERYKRELERAAGAFNYINSKVGLFANKHNNIKYYKNGEDLFPDFLEGL